MEHKNDFRFQLVLNFRKSLVEIRDRNICIHVKHESHKEKVAEADNPKGSDDDKEEWTAICELSNIQLRDTIVIEFIADKGLKNEEKASIYLPHKDLFECCKKSDQPLERNFPLVKNNINKECHLGNLVILLQCVNPVGTLPETLYDPIVLIPGETLRVKLSNNNASKEWVSIKNEKGEKLMWAKWYGTSLAVMHGKDHVGLASIKEKMVPLVYFRRKYTFFYHGERICRTTFRDMSADSVIEFYNGQMPVTLQGQRLGHEKHLYEITATRDNEVIARFTYEKKKKLILIFFKLTFKYESDFPLLAFITTILGTQKNSYPLN